MQNSINIDIGIREIRQLTGFMKEKYGADYTEYALTSFKRRVEGFMTANRCDWETLFKKLESKDFLDLFVARIAVGVTEMFRDPSFWILLKNNYLTSIVKDNAKTRIWLPLCASGEELYSLAILLKESGWTDRVDVFVSCVCNQALETIQRGWMDNEALEISAKNYSRFQGTGQLSDYYKSSTNGVEFNRSLFAQTQYFKEGIELNSDLPPIHLILFRNQLIYFNPSLQNRVCELLHGKLAVKGILALGILEEIDMNIHNKFTILNKGESIYQRKL